MVSERLERLDLIKAIMPLPNSRKAGGRPAFLLSINWLRVSPGRQICLEAAAVLDFPPLQPDRLKSSFLEGQNGCKPPKIGDSDAIGARIV